MKAIIQKASVLIEALPYIQKFRGETVVVKFGGSAMEDEANMDSVLADVTFMQCVGMLPVIVHGGGKAISRSMTEAGIQPKFVKGLRVTCEKTIEVVRKVIHGQINPRIVAKLKGYGARARGMAGEEVLRVTRKVEKDADTGETLDWGFVGEPHEVRTQPILELCDQGIIPVLTPLGLGMDGKVHNVNADTAASAIAEALKARKLAILSDVPGLLRDPKDESSLISTLRVKDVARLTKEGVITGGMLPKVQSALEALKAGVRKIHMIDGRMPHSLLLEIFTDKGVGTEIIDE